MAQQDLEFPADDAREYYAVLNVPPDASDEDIRRAYRNLAQVYHPDKHTDPEQKKRAEEAFARLQEAYEVLSDPQRRQIYDVYGKEGLHAGFTLGDRLDSLEELKKKWEEFKKKQEAERAELLSNHRGFYQCRIDASDLRPGLRGLLGLGPGGAQELRPLFRSIMVQNSIDTPVGEADVFYLQGYAAVRNNAGGGNLVCGYRRVLSPHDTLEGNAVLGLRSVLSLTSTRQVTPYTSASLTTSYTAGVGLGMQVSSTRHLPFNMQATLGWVVGPAPASGVSFNVSKRGAKYFVGGKLEVGAVTSVSARAGYQLNPGTSLKAAVRVGSTGVELELGAGRKWNASTSGYMATVVGLQGITFKGKLIRGGQTFEVPVLLSSRYNEPYTLVAAYLVPPLTYIALSRCVVRPLVRWHRRRQEQREQQEHADAIRKSVQKAQSERALINPVARRKARAEAAKRGLVILDAVYGKVESYMADGGPQHVAVAASASTAAAAAPSTSESTAVASSTATAVQPPAESAPGAADGDAAAPTGTASAGAPGDEPRGATSTSSGDAGSDAPTPPPWLSVTSALQYLVADSRLTLHPGVAKKNQMGFADPTPGGTATRHLYVAYLHGGRVYEVTVDDTDGLQLPGAGEAVADAGRRAALLSLGAAAHGLQGVLL